MSSHFHTLIIDDIRKETTECVSISFSIPDDLKPVYRFHAGQNLTLRSNINGQEIRRSYSICSCADDNELRIAVKMIPGGRFSHFANMELKRGDKIDVLPPSGKFYTELNRENRKRYLAIAAGSGITPILSIIRTTLAAEPYSMFTLLYGNRNRNSIIFREQLENIKNQYMKRFAIHHILSREKMDAEVNSGRINAEKCEQLNEKLVHFSRMDQIFLCGPADMIFSVKDWLLAKGIDPNIIHFELFLTPGQPVQTKQFVPKVEKEMEGRSSTVYITLDGNQFGFDLPFNGDSILDAALKQGADLPYACKGGVCATCKAKLVSGEVHMNTNYSLEAEEIQKGFILTCQSHPRTEKLMIDFDVR